MTRVCLVAECCLSINICILLLFIITWHVATIKMHIVTASYCLYHKQIIDETKTSTMSIIWPIIYTMVKSTNACYYFRHAIFLSSLICHFYDMHIPTTKYRLHKYTQIKQTAAYNIPCNWFFNFHTILGLHNYVSLTI